jgi:hypothetical protein
MKISLVKLLHRWRAACAVLVLNTSLFAQVPPEFKEADLALGAQLMAQHKCEACHIGKVGGNGSAIYRPKGRISTAGFLRGMVEQCNTELNLAMFPDEVTAIAAVLNRDHYRFK